MSMPEILAPAGSPEALLAALRCGAGHSREIAKRLIAGGQLIGFDRDPDAVAVATERLVGYPATVVTVVNSASSSFMASSAVSR